MSDARLEGACGLELSAVRPLWFRISEEGSLKNVTAQVLVLYGIGEHELDIGRID
jgi:hypothetical protein